VAVSDLTALHFDKLMKSDGGFQIHARRRSSNTAPSTTLRLDEPSPLVGWQVSPSGICCVHMCLFLEGTEHAGDAAGTEAKRSLKTHSCGEGPGTSSR
jgi:hypothetical protein